jgi:plastocyanin
MKTFTFVAALVVAFVGSAVRADEWGTIKGRFLLGGDPAAAAELKVDKDVEVCGKHKLLAEELVVGADKGIANVVVFVRDKTVKPNPDLKATEPVVLDNKDCRFEPHVAFVQVGQPLVIKNSDTVGHNSNIASQKNPSNSLVPAGGEAKVTFSADEAVPAAVTCNIHPWMKGWVLIRPNPYAAVSKADGTFEIKGVPAGGEVELQFWHEKAGYVAEMTIGGKAEKVSKGRKKVNVAAAGTDLGDIVLPPGIFQK